jgi:hypothetical protein
MTIRKVILHLQYYATKPDDIGMYRWRGIQKYIETRYLEGTTLDKLYAESEERHMRGWSI